MTEKNKALQNESNKIRFLINPLYQKDLIKTNRFVCYKSNKQPYNAITRQRTDVTNKMNHTTYENACNSVKNNEYFEGIGFVLGYDPQNSCNYCGLDIDNCIDEQGNISDEAQTLIDMLNTYTEISKSGRGIHCIFIAKKPGNVCKNNKLNFCKCLELYDNGRYFALTGMVINNKDIEPRQDECNIIYDRYFKQKELSMQTTTMPDISQTNNNKTYGADYLKYILEKDLKFASYWNRTIEITDESASDQAFINKLAYWLDCKFEIMKDWFYNSRYYQLKDDKHKKKANRKDYIDRTINNAINYHKQRGIL